MLLLFSRILAIQCPNIHPRSPLATRHSFSTKIIRADENVLLGLLRSLQHVRMEAIITYPKEGSEKCSGLSIILFFL